MSALIFFSAAAGKMRNWPTFRGVVANYRLLPEFLVAPVAYLLPPLEAAIGVGLLTPWASPWAERAAAAMFTLFATAMAVNLTRGPPCHRLRVFSKHPETDAALASGGA